MAHVVPLYERFVGAVPVFQFQSRILPGQLPPELDVLEALLDELLDAELLADELLEAELAADELLELLAAPLEALLALLELPTALPLVPIPP